MWLSRLEQSHSTAFVFTYIATFPIPFLNSQQSLLEKKGAPYSVSLTKILDLEFSVENKHKKKN